ncbi:flagellar basal-body rod protein FlgG [Thermatribacter velox]|uniref:Flagellar basal-body rod protein FlgG n=1 Tax=Thermatribacter velox TaxID=3039681 RepID=A0ABZ2YCD5_9BACT
MRALWTAATGMQAKQLDIDVIANNLANINTTGFKKSRVDFQDLMYQTVRVKGAPNTQENQIPTGIEVGLGVRPAAVQKLFFPGDAYETGNPLDIAIEGDGFFQVLLADGTIGYTRDGSFKLDAQGRIVTSDGFPLEPPITVPQDAESITIGQDGTVTAKIAGETEPQELGVIELARFINPAGLQSIGRNLYVATVASGEPQVGTPGFDGLGTLAQGFLETSNVQVVEEMVRMISAQRAYEINSKAISVADEMMSIANNMKR